MIHLKKAAAAEVAGTAETVEILEEAKVAKEKVQTLCTKRLNGQTQRVIHSNHQIAVQLLKL